MRLALALVALGLGAPGLAQEPAAAPVAPPAGYQNLLTPLLEGGVDVLGRPIAFPPGAANITAAIVEVPPGGETGLHHHEVPLFAYILEGALTVDYGEKGTKVYEAGMAVLEAVDWPHNGRNLGTVPMRLLAVYMGSDEAANTVAETVN